MLFEWTITLGNLIAAVGPVLGFIITGIYFINRIGVQIVLLDQRMGNVEVDLKDMSMGIKTLAKDNSQIIALSEKAIGFDRRINEVGQRLLNLENRFMVAK